MRKNIIITGFMGTGKSVVAKELARKLKMEFIDMDQIIEEDQGMSISDIFARYGENYFREQENKLVKKLSQKENMVIATGGGTLLSSDNARMLGQAGEIVCLYADSQTIYNRVKLEERKKIYDNIKWKINTTNFTTQEVVDKIINLLKLER
ncbi:shikimate kinase [Candidatus Atribacteria bacterium HGW-Atribacteria-1]|nr:MAG: shikimate kinase [Candidatus Atribacteria bacterium HGW-Atribacteria-1]